jgi:hypothetical protein
MSDKNTNHLKFAESDTPVQRTVISTFMDVYNAYYRATRGVDVDRLLAEIVLTSRALREIGEVDESICEALEQACRELSEKMTHVGRMTATVIQHMHNKRNGGEGMESVKDAWPDMITENEQ